MRHLLLSGLAAISLSATATAGTLTYSGYDTSAIQQNVHLTDAGLGVIGEYGGAGEIILTGTNTPGGTFPAWCVDIQDWFQTAGSYASGTSPSALGLSQTTANEIGALIYHFNIGTVGNDTYTAAAIQMAIWQVEYGPGLAVTPDSGGLTALAKTYATDATNGTRVLPSNWDLELLYAGPQGNGNQNLAYVVDPAPIAEPPTLTLLGAGLVGLIGLDCVAGARFRRGSDLL